METTPSHIAEDRVFVSFVRRAGREASAAPLGLSDACHQYCLREMTRAVQPARDMLSTVLPALSSQPTSIFADGKIVERWGESNTLGFLEQIDAEPAR